MKITYNLALGLILVSGGCLARVGNDNEALSYCKARPNTYIAIMWPIAQGRQQEVEAIFREFGTIIYQKKMRLTAETAFKILKKAHTNITDMAAHMSWYFPQGALGRDARVFVFECSNHDNVVACKHKIRRLFNLQYRSIHINDTHRETLELAHMLLRNKIRTHEQLMRCYFCLPYIADYEKRTLLVK